MTTTWTSPSKTVTENPIFVEDWSIMLDEAGGQMLRESEQPTWFDNTKHTAIYSSPIKSTTTWSSPIKN